MRHNNERRTNINPLPTILGVLLIGSLLFGCARSDIAPLVINPSGLLEAKATEVAKTGGVCDQYLNSPQIKDACNAAVSATVGIRVNPYKDQNNPNCSAAWETSTGSDLFLVTASHCLPEDTEPKTVLVFDENGLQTLKVDNFISTAGYDQTILIPKKETFKFSGTPLFYSDPASSTQIGETVIGVGRPCGINSASWAYVGKVFSNNIDSPEPLWKNTIRTNLRPEQFSGGCMSGGPIVKPGRLVKVGGKTFYASFGTHRLGTNHGDSTGFTPNAINSFQ